jgi:putative SOS response-associated peptidase YedK
VRVTDADLFEQLQREGEPGIDRLILERTQETVELDFKLKETSSHGGFSDGDKRTLGRAFSAFANSSGGLLIWGVPGSPCVPILQRRELSMVERILQTEKARLLGMKIVESANDANGYSQLDEGSLWVIRRNWETGERSVDLLQWGLIPSRCHETPDPLLRVARAETVSTKTAFREAYAKRRAILPVDALFQWRATRGANRGGQFNIRMKDGSMFGVASIWENWRDPLNGEWLRTFAILTTGANELLEPIHDRMPVILHPSDYDRWLGPEPDPSDLLRQFPAELMTLSPLDERSRNRDAPSLFDDLPP